MSRSHPCKPKYRTLWFITLAAVLIWTLVLGGLLWNTLQEEHDHMMELAKNEAITNYNRDLSLRNWVSRHSGVYVEIGKGTQPNPYLAGLPERDIESLSGRKFTLVNPDHMLRQTTQEFADYTGIQSRLISLKPLSPDNAADAWESRALKQFQTGTDAVSEIAKLNGVLYLRYLQALITQEGCLKCHTEESYRIGDVQGGLGVLVPLAPYLEIEQQHTTDLSFSYAGIWLFGLCSIGLGFGFSRKRVLGQWLTERELLENSRLLEQERQLFITGPTVVFRWRPEAGWPVEYVSPNVIEQLGYTKAELESGAVVFADLVYPEDLQRVGAEVMGYAESRIASFEQEYRLRHRDGTYRWFYDLTNIIRNTDGAITFFHGYIQDITERKQVRENLERSEAKYRTVINNTQEGFWFIGPDNLTLEANEALYSLLGYPREEILGKSPLDFLDENNHQIMQEKLTRISSTDHRIYEIDLRRKDGIKVPVQFSATTLWNERHEVIGSFAFVSDLRVRKATENALRETKDRLAFALEGAQEGLWDWKIQTGEVYFSPRMESMLGYQLGEWQPHVETWKRLVHPDDMAEVLGRLHDHLDGRTTFYQTEHRMRHKDGHWVWVKDSGCVVERDAGGQPLRAVGTHVDISELKQIEQVLRRSQTGLAEAQRIAKLGSWELDLTTNELTWSDEVYRIFEVDQERFKVTCEAFLDMIHPDDREKVERAYHESLLHKTPYDIIHRLPMRDGRVKYVHELCETQYDEQGAPISSQGTAQDITERYLAELELIQAKEQAETATRAKSDFLATMSHEIRTPMNGVIGMAEILAESKLDSPQRESVEVIRSSGQLLLNLLNDILDFSKLEAEQVELESLPFDLEELCFKVLELVVPQANEKGLELIFDYPPECPRQFQGDPVRIRQILLNLVSNALKFTEQGFVRLCVQHHQADANRSRLCLLIEDTGIGIQTEQQDRLFHAFAQADETTTRKYGGTGLGLSISRKLLKLMGGEISVESEIGSGAVFRVELELANVHSDRAFLEQEMPGIRLLLLDQSKAAHHSLKQLFDYLGIIATKLSNGEQVLPELIRASQTGEPYQIAILDQPKQASDAIVLGQAIRHLSELHDLQLLVLTGLGHRGDAADFKRAGFDAYLNKPLSSTTLVKVLRCLLEAENGEKAREREIITRYLVEQRDESRITTEQFHGRILLVEDVLANRKVAGAMLRRLGVTVDFAENGLQAVVQWQKGGYDLIFMDCRMPEMDGYAATRIIRQQEQHKQIPIVALTANALPRDRQLCREAGMDDIILKPFSKSDLASCLKKWLGVDEASLRLQVQYRREPEFRSDSLLNLDFSVLERLEAEMGEDFSEVMGAIRQSISEILLKLEQEHATLPPNEVIRLAHSLKSPSATIGAKHLYAMASDFEQAADQGKVIDIPARLMGLKQEFQQVLNLMSERGF